MENFIKIQEKFIKKIDNSTSSGRLPHAFLIEANSEKNLDYAISYILASIFNKGNILDKEYISLLQQESPDVLIYDLNESKLNKEDALTIQERFNKKALDISNKQVYIIKNIDKATPIVLNSLLKFLEEPSENIYAIFTTQNKEKVLETIISRTSVYTLKNNDIQLIRDILSESYNYNDVYLVSLISEDENIMQDYLNSNVFKDFKAHINSLLESVNSDFLFLKIHELLDDYEKEDLELFFSLFYLVLTNKMIHSSLNISERAQELLTNSSNYGMLLDAVLTARIRLDSNANKSLIVDSFGIEVERCL